MNEIVLTMSNVRPLRQKGTGSGTGRFEAMYPEQNPRWHFLSVDDFSPVHTADGAAGTSPSAPVSDGDASLAMRAIPHGPRIGVEARGPVAIWTTLANAIEGKEAEFNEWYDHRHIHDVVSLPGLISGQRFTLAPVAEGAPLPWKYLCLYELEQDRAAEALAELAARRGTARMPNPGYLAPGAMMATYKPID